MPASSRRAANFMARVTELLMSQMRHLVWSRRTATSTKLSFIHRDRIARGSGRASAELIRGLNPN
jgi:hypothetical protein